MNTNVGSIVQKLIGILVAFCAMTIILLYLFEGNIGGKLLYPAIASGVFCVFLIYSILINSKSLTQQPFGIYLIAGFYLIVCLLLCFPNPYMESIALIYLIAVPVSYFLGFRHAVVIIFCTAVLSNTGGISRTEIQHIGYILIAAATASGKKQNGLDIWSAITAFLLQGILLLLSKSSVAADAPDLLTELIIVLCNSITIPLVYRLASLKETAQNIDIDIEAEKDSVLSVAEAIPGVDIIVKEESVQEDGSVSGNLILPLAAGSLRYPLELSYLINDDCVILKSMNDFAPRAVERAKEIASFAREIAYKFGVNSDLVYAAAIYHDVERIYKGEPGPEVVLPEYLYTIVKRQNDKQAPASIEELIVLLSNNVLAIYHYIEKKHPQISVSKVIDNLFAHHLKNGNIMTAGISMSAYHKMRQEFTNEFIIYLESKKR